jgi:hypothetical protein
MYLAYTLVSAAYQPRRQSEKEVDKLLKKHMLESEDQLDVGLKNKAFKEKDCIRVDQTMHRICAPTDNSKARSFILWTKKSPKDTKPTWEKVVRRNHRCSSTSYAN